MSRWSNWSRGTKPPKMLSDFLKEGPVDTPRTGNPTGTGQLSPADRARQLGLQSNGKGGYIDPNTGQIVARTVNNELIFYSAAPGGGAVSDGSGGSVAANPSSSWQDPISGLMTTPPGQPESPNEIAAVPDPVPAQAPAGYNEFILKRKQELYMQDYEARQQPPAPPEQDPEGEAPMGGMSMPEEPMPAMAQENYTPADLLKRSGGMGPPTFSDLRDRMKRGFEQNAASGNIPQQNQAVQQASPAPQEAPTPAAAAAPAKQGRRDSGNQFTELVTGAVLANPNARSIEDVINSRIPHANIARRDGFIGDLDNPRNTPEFIQQYAGNLAKLIDGKFGAIDPQNVFVRANNNELAPAGIVDAIRKLGSGEHKADVLFQHGDADNPQYGGIGVKQDHNATLTNYSIESMLEDAYNERIKGLTDPTNENYDPTFDSRTEYFDESDPKHISWGQRVRDAREGMFKRAGLPSNMAELKEAYPKARKKNGRDFDWHHDSVPKELRKKYGELFVPDENDYHGEFFQQLIDNKDDFMKQFYGKLFPQNLPYNLYNYDGENLEEFSKEGLIGPGDVDLIPSLNHAADPKGAAKGFLTMLHDGKPRMRMETRHKGNPFGSQQLFTHRWNEGKDLFNPLR